MRRLAAAVALLLLLAGCASVGSLDGEPCRISERFQGGMTCWTSAWSRETGGRWVRQPVEWTCRAIPWALGDPAAYYYDYICHERSLR